MTDAAERLLACVRRVDWDRNSSAFCENPSWPQRVDDALAVVAVWVHQLEKMDQGNPALSFVREAHSSAIAASVLMAVGMYKPAAASMRACLECAMYFSFFRDHPAELRTLTLSPAFYVTKEYIVDYFKTHGVRFGEREQAVAFLSRLAPWYARISAVIHGQVPGVWSNGPRLDDDHSDSDRVVEVLEFFERMSELVNGCFIATLPEAHMRVIDKSARDLLAKGMSAEKRRVLML